MKKISKKQIAKLKKETGNKDNWTKVDSFSASKSTSIRLPPELIDGLETLADLRGERSYQALLKQWVTERVRYELELINLAKRRKTG